MSMWTAIALIAIASIFCGTIRRRHHDTDDSKTHEKLDALEQQLEKLDRDLRERVETLERIVTDSKADLKRQFEYLDKAS